MCSSAIEIPSAYIRSGDGRCNGYLEKFYVKQFASHEQFGTFIQVRFGTFIQVRKAYNFFTSPGFLTQAEDTGLGGKLMK